MTVYVLMWGAWCDYGVQGVFSTLELAKAAADPDGVAVWKEWPDRTWEWSRGDMDPFEIQERIVDGKG